MGRATITANLGEGLYRILIDLDTTNADAEKLSSQNQLVAIAPRIATAESNVVAAQAVVDTALSDLNTLIDTGTPTQVKAFNPTVIIAKRELSLARRALTNAKTARLSLIQRVSELTRKTPVDFEVNAWCADYNPDLAIGLIVGTIEVTGERQASIPTIIKPGGVNGNEAGWQSSDGVLQPVISSISPAAYYNAALHGATEKWKPGYRFGTIMAIDRVAETCEVALDPASVVDFPSLRVVDVNLNANLSGVPFDYMDDGPQTFGDRDKVVIGFRGRDVERPFVIGYQGNPVDATGIELDLLFPLPGDFDTHWTSVIKDDYLIIGYFAFNGKIKIVGYVLVDGVWVGPDLLHEEVGNSDIDLTEITTDLLEKDIIFFSDTDRNRGAGTVSFSNVYAIWRNDGEFKKQLLVNAVDFGKDSIAVVNMHSNFCFVSISVRLPLFPTTLHIIRHYDLLQNGSISSGDLLHRIIAGISSPSIVDFPTLIVQHGESDDLNYFIHWRYGNAWFSKDLGTDTFSNVSISNNGKTVSFNIGVLNSITWRISGNSARKVLDLTRDVRVRTFIISRDGSLIRYLVGGISAIPVTEHVIIKIRDDLFLDSLSVLNRRLSSSVSGEDSPDDGNMVLLGNSGAGDNKTYSRRHESVDFPRGWRPEQTVINSAFKQSLISPDGSAYTTLLGSISYFNESDEEWSISNPDNLTLFGSTRLFRTWGVLVDFSLASVPITVLQKKSNSLELAPLTAPLSLNINNIANSMIRKENEAVYIFTTNELYRLSVRSQK